MAAICTDFEYPVDITENILVPMPDGTQLAAKLWRPRGAGPVPVILEYLPYRKREGMRTRDQKMHGWLAGNGYACVRLDIRGSGDSQGLITDEYSEQELEDGCAAIAWIAAQDWCDGQVAMFGLSWSGFNGLQIAARRPPALRTVIAAGFTDDRYATDVHYVGGCLSKDNFDWSSTMLASNALPPDPEIVGPDWRAMWLDRLAHYKPWILTWLAHQRRDSYWKHGSVCEDFSAITVPVMAVSGWADNYSEAVPRLLAGLTAPCQGLVGPWAHSFPNDVTVEPAIGWLQEVRRWCDHWMKGIDTGIMQEPKYRVWMQESLPPATCYSERPGRWVAEAAWPSDRIEARRLCLNAGGTLDDRPGPVAALPVCSPLWVGNGAGEIGRYGDAADWPTDQRTDDGGSLVFVTAPLPARCEILGAPRLHLRFSVDKPLALAAVRLNDVRPDGQSTRVTFGCLNLTHRDSHEHASLLEPGRIHEAVIELDDIAHAFPAGHRIAVSVSTTYWPICWPSPELATLAVMAGDSWLELPVRPADPADADLRPYGPAQVAASTPTIYHPMEPAVRRSVSRDLLTGDIVVDFPRWTYKQEMTDIRQTVVSDAMARYRITDGQPLSAVCETATNVVLHRPDGVFAHHATGRLSCDATHFRVEVALRVTENGVTVADHTWDERIPRDHG